MRKARVRTRYTQAFKISPRVRVNCECSTGMQSWEKKFLWWKQLVWKFCLWAQILSDCCTVAISSELRHWNLRTKRKRKTWRNFVSLMRFLHSKGLFLKGKSEKGSFFLPRSYELITLSCVLFCFPPVERILPFFWFPIERRSFPATARRWPSSPWSDLVKLRRIKTSKCIEE